MQVGMSQRNGVGFEGPNGWIWVNRTTIDASDPVGENRHGNDRERWRSAHLWQPDPMSPPSSSIT
jgi:hypothetical protein